MEREVRKRAELERVRDARIALLRNQQAVLRDSRALLCAREPQAPERAALRRERLVPGIDVGGAQEPGAHAS